MMNTGRMVAAAARAAVIAAALLTLAVVVAVLRYRLDWIGAGLVLIAVAVLPIPLVGSAAVRAQPRNQVGWMLLAAGVSLPLGLTAYAIAHTAFSPWAGWLDAWPWTPALTVLPTVGLLLFPDGRLPSRRWAPALWLGWAVNIAQLLYAWFAPALLDFPDRANPTALPGAYGAFADALGLTIGLVAPLATVSAVAVFVRFRRAPRGGPDRAALRLILPAAVLAALSWWSCMLVVSVWADSDKALAAEIAGLLAIAATAWVAVRRYGMFDGRQVLHRALVYAALSVLVVAVYLLAAAVVGLIVSAAAGRTVALVAAVLVAIPLHGWLRRLANRIVYGYSDDPSGALAYLGARLRGAAAADDVLPGVADSVRSALRLPGVRIEIGAEAVTTGPVVFADAEQFPLVFAGERIGTLTAARREPGRPFGAGERRVLTDVAQQIAAAGHAVTLSRDLRRSRERLVTATAEERRRIRRDLHDGLGPTLAGVVLGLQRIHGRTADADVAAQLDQLTEQTRTAIAEVRRLVYDLRPPALDELGLVGALDEQARTLGGITVTGPAVEPAWPAAVEVAAYRIAMEAMTNVVRHARAQIASVTLSVNGALELEVVDDGVGLPAGFRAGVGIASMRERATELGGTCAIEPGERSGTRVRAVLPLEPR
ncbi:GAF domain-containing sensor histidine kinase [Actinoplanes sp. NPDC051411]|uniref:sensor histidine kinase n=1 Tax=Actinoplanes sp. NPDC051411 TaxID=3155522 RepID=UPI00343D360C